MRLNKKQRERALKQICGVINEDDAIDPRHYFYNKRKTKSEFRKAYQLSRQVAETLHLVLSDGDPLLEDLQILDVVPAPDARRMLVILGMASSEVVSATQIEAIMERLQAHLPRLRSEVARSITRRRTPQLVFEITAR